MTTKERIDLLEASHVRLMTEHELAMQESDRSWARHHEWFRQFEAQREKDRAEQARRSAEIDSRFIAMDERIGKLVVGIGEFITNRVK